MPDHLGAVIFELVCSHFKLTSSKRSSLPDTQHQASRSDVRKSQLMKASQLVLLRSDWSKSKQKDSVGQPTESSFLVSESEFNVLKVDFKNWANKFQDLCFKQKALNSYDSKYEYLTSTRQTVMVGLECVILNGINYTFREKLLFTTQWGIKDFWREFKKLISCTPKYRRFFEKKSIHFSSRESPETST